jgi:hypothetical protein
MNDASDESEERGYVMEIVICVEYLQSKEWNNIENTVYCGG